MSGDLQGQVSDLKHFLRTLANSVERHLRSHGGVSDLVEADKVGKAHKKHHEYCTGRMDARAREARVVINKVSDFEGGPHVEELEDSSGWRLPGRKEERLE